MGSPEHSLQPVGDASHESGGHAPAARQVTPDNQLLDAFWGRIRRHKAVEWTLAYVAFGLRLLHGVEMLRDALE